MPRTRDPVRTAPPRVTAEVDAALRPADTLMLDVGGVLFGDPWETLLLTPGTGLADRLGLDRLDVDRAGTALWPEFSRRPRTAGEYWDGLAAALGVAVPARLVRELEETLLRPGPDAAALLGLAARRYKRIGVISDNTAFWYPWQAAELRLDDVLDPDLVFLSYLHGAGKSDRPGLYDAAVARVPPGRTLVVDDRAHNLARAAALGFRTVHYAMGSAPVSAPGG
ncbi:MAG TPA: hypothetical protein VGL93_32420 [Streptosporangiaceae bacterium]